MCVQIVVEKEFVVKAVREFKQRYPQTAQAYKAALRSGAKFAREGGVVDNENGSFTVKTASGSQEYLIVNKVCACGIGKPCAHRIAVNVAKIALEIRAATSDFLLDRAEVQHVLTDERAQYVVTPATPVENPNDFHTESDEVRAILREQEERDASQ